MLSATSLAAVLVVERFASYPFTGDDTLQCRTYYYHSFPNWFLKGISYISVFCYSIS